MKKDNNEAFYSFDKLLVNELKNPEFNRKFQKEYLKIELINQITAIRKSKKMTQKQMAEIVGVPQANISRFENGKVEPTLDF